MALFVGSGRCRECGDSVPPDVYICRKCKRKIKDKLDKSQSE